MLEAGRDADSENARDILSEAAAAQGLAPAQAAVLLQTREPSVREEVLETARRVHAKAFGRVVGLVAPICPTNRCVNDCLYCPLRRPNSSLRRRAAGVRDIQREIGTLLDEGYRCVCLVFGEDRSGVRYVRDMIWATRGARSPLRHVDHVDVNLNPMRSDEMSGLAEALGSGTHHVFQETYDPVAYAALHPDGPKAQYAWRLTGQDRAYEAGVGAAGLGLLLGAGPVAFDVIALLSHARHLAAAFGRGPRAITYPRMVPAAGAPASQDPSRRVDDETFCHVVAVTRLALPDADLILSTPASPETRVQLFGLGISRVSVGSASYPGVHTADGAPETTEAVHVGRTAALDEVVGRMCEARFVPNLCGPHDAPARRVDLLTEAGLHVAGRERRTVNALLALKEYLMDYGSPETRAVGERLIQQELAQLPDRVRAVTLELMEEAEAGLRGQVV